MLLVRAPANRWPTRFPPRGPAKEDPAVCFQSNRESLPLRPLTPSVDATILPQTPDPRPQTPDPRPQTPDPRPQTPDPRPQTPDPRPQTPDPRPQTPDPRPQTPDPRPQTPDPRPQTPGSGVAICWLKGSRAVGPQGIGRYPGVAALVLVACRRPLNCSHGANDPANTCGS